MGTPRSLILLCLGCAFAQPLGRDLQLPSNATAGGAKPVAQKKIKAALKPAFTQSGIASWYDGKTATGAAHRHLPFGTYVRVTNLLNDRSAVVKINDRGPFIKGRIIDVSQHAAKELAMVNSGTARVRIEVLSQPQG